MPYRAAATATSQRTARSPRYGDKNAPNTAEEAFSMTTVAREQFEISHSGITHTPTGYSFIPHPGSPTSGSAKMGRLGDQLPSGDDYRPHEVEAMAKELWAEYCATHNLK